MRRLVKLFGRDALDWFDERARSGAAAAPAQISATGLFSAIVRHDGLAGSKVYYETRPHQLEALPRALLGFVSTALQLMPNLTPVFTTISCRRESGGQRVTFLHRGPLRLADLGPLLGLLGMEQELAGIMQTFGLALGGRFELPGESVLSRLGRLPKDPSLDLRSARGNSRCPAEFLGYCSRWGWRNGRVNSMQCCGGSMRSRRKAATGPAISPS